MHILDILIDLKAQTGSGSVERKMAILEEYKDKDLLKDFFFWALDPNTNYWQSKITKKDIKSGIISLNDAMGIITDLLVSREVTGDKAKNILNQTYQSLREKDQELLERIITGKPDVGFSVSTINKVWPGLIYDPSYMRCQGYSPKLIGASRDRKAWDFENEVIYSNLKADGMFVNIILGDNIEFETRSGEQLFGVADSLEERHTEILDFLRVYIRMSDVITPVLHGELLVVKDGEIMERSKGNGLINKVKQGGVFPPNHYLRIVIWDYISKESFLSHSEYTINYNYKFGYLADYLEGMGNERVQLIEYKRVYSMMEAQAHFVKCLQAGFEGTVLKNASRLTWKNHDSPNQLKLKNKFRFEMRVTGFIEGEGKFAPTFGAMEIISECGLLKSSISGIKDKLRQEIFNNRGSYIDAVVEVEANGLFKNDDGTISLMHPRYKELRSDRVLADTQERIIQQEIDSIMGKEIEKNG